MKNKNIIPIIAIILAFVLICAALCCAFIAIGDEFDLYNNFFGNDQPESTEATVEFNESTSNYDCALFI